MAAFSRVGLGRGGRGGHQRAMYYSYGWEKNGGIVVIRNTMRPGQEPSTAQKEVANV